MDSGNADSVTKNGQLSPQPDKAPVDNTALDKQQHHQQPNDLNNNDIIPPVLAPVAVSSEPGVSRTSPLPIATTSGDGKQFEPVSGETSGLIDWKHRQEKMEDVPQVIQAGTEINAGSRQSVTPKDKMAVSLDTVIEDSTDPNKTNATAASKNKSIVTESQNNDSEVTNPVFPTPKTPDSTGGVGRPPSLLPYPLMHPNGMSIFPTLSTTEQEDLAREALTQAQDAIIADNFDYHNGGDNASDGGYESDGFSSASTSAESSVRAYLYENGRRYHSFREGTYNFPNDDIEQEREDMKHAMLKLLCSQKLHFSPIGSNPQEILDIGTGTGIWAIEMGDQFPSAHVLGVDLSPIQPDWLPPNVKFLVDDIESPWLYARNHFDYIHSRHTVMAIKDWMRLFRRALEHLKPGAWIELQEIHHSPRSAGGDGTVPTDHPVAQFWSLVTAGLVELGVDLNIAAGGQLASMMQAAGFVNVTERVLHVPIGTWPKNKVLKTVGLYWRTILLDGLQAIALGPLTRGLGWKREEVEVFLTTVRRDYHDNSALMYMPLHVVYAQKPMNSA